MKKILIVLIFIIITGCDKIDNQGAIIGAPCIIPVITNENIVVNIEKDSSKIYLDLESNERIIIPEKCISNFEVNKQKWELMLEYHDEKRVSLPYMGDSLFINPDSIFINPGGSAPLTALIKFSTPIERKIMLNIPRRKPENALISLVINDFKTEHEIPVYGLYSNYNNPVEISILDYYDNPVITDTIYIQTEEAGRLQSGEMTVEINDYLDYQKNRLFLIQNAIYDGAGDVRWYTNLSGQKFYRLASRKIAIQVYPDRGYIGDGPDLRIINLFGEVLDTFNVPNRMHHECIEKTPGGNLLIASNSNEYKGMEDDTEDMIVEIDRVSGDVVKEWDLRNIFDPERQRLWEEQKNDWCHLNSIQYDSTDNSLLISSKLQYFIAKIDYDTGNLKWILGNHENWKDAWQPYLLEPLNFDTTSNADKDWPYAQHMPRISGENSIIVYDNGGNRPGGAYTRAIEYQVDPGNMTVEKLWSYKMDEFASALGSVGVYEDNSVQVGHGLHGMVYEVDRNENLLFKANLKSYYRVYPIKLY